MASLWRHPKSQFWTACFTAADGRQLKRSTRTTDRKAALKIAEQYEEAARRKRAASQTRRVIADLHKALTGEALTETTLRGYTTDWLAKKKHETAPTTLTFYRAAVEKFCGFLGDRADEPLGEVNARDILDYRNARIREVSAVTTNHELKTLRTLFRGAKREGLIADDPTENVETVRDRVQRETRPFTVDEIRAVLNAADPEWRSMVLCALYTGQRLSDIAALTWNNVDLNAGEVGEVRVVTRKTGKRLVIPIAPPLREHFESLPASDEPGAPIHPRAHRVLTEKGRTGELSRQFGELLAQAGLRAKTTHKATGKGRTSARNRHEISFHALRRTATTWMHEGGIPAAVVQALIGHDSPDVHALYVSVGREALVTAVKTMPSVL